MRLGLASMRYDSPFPKREAPVVLEEGAYYVMPSGRKVVAMHRMSREYGFDTWMLRYLGIGDRGFSDNSIYWSERNTRLLKAV